jgi:hypothetical protein
MAAPYPVGSIVIPNDLAAGSAKVISAAGSIIGTENLVQCEMGDIVQTGILALGDVAGTSPQRAVNVALYNVADMSVVASVSFVSIFGAGFPFDNFSPIRGNVDRFYVVGNKIGDGLAPRRVGTVDLAGNVGGTLWTLGGMTNGTQVRSMAVNADNTRLYYSLQDTNSAIYAHNLTTNTDLGTFIAADAGGDNTGLDIFVLPNGHLLISYGFASGDTDFETRRFNSAGVLQATYPLIVNAGTASPVFISPWLGESNVFWSRSFIDVSGNTARYDKWSISGVSVTSTFDLLTVDGGGTVPLCCPMIVLPSPPVPEQDLSEPCCPCDCPAPVKDGTPSRTPPVAHTGPILPPVELSWDRNCSGGGTVPTAADPTDSESWVS